MYVCNRQGIFWNFFLEMAAQISFWQCHLGVKRVAKMGSLLERKKIRKSSKSFEGTGYLNRCLKISFFEPKILCKMLLLHLFPIIESQFTKLSTHLKKLTAHSYIEREKKNFLKKKESIALIPSFSPRRVGGGEKILNIEKNALSTHSFLPKKKISQQY